MNGLLNAWRRETVLPTAEQLEKAELAKTLDDIGLARFFGRLSSNVITNDKLAYEVINEHVRKAADQGPVVRVLKAIFA